MGRSLLGALTKMGEWLEVSSCAWKASLTGPCSPLSPDRVAFVRGLSSVRAAKPVQLEADGHAAART
jgi:hypothetical protein